MSGSSRTAGGLSSNTCLSGIGVHARRFGSNSLAAYLAGQGADVWGIDLAWTIRHARSRSVIWSVVKLTVEQFYQSVVSLTPFCRFPNQRAASAAHEFSGGV
jgi:hypothetical protein